MAKTFVGTKGLGVIIPTLWKSGFSGPQKVETRGLGGKGGIKINFVGKKKESSSKKNLSAGNYQGYKGRVSKATGNRF